MALSGTVATLEDTQAALINQMKANPVIVSSLPPTGTTGLEIREIDWFGENFQYPNIRVHVQNFDRENKDAYCNNFDVVAVVYVFAEDNSSKKCNQIGTKVFQMFDRHGFNDSITGLVTPKIRATQKGATYYRDGGVWQSIVELRFRVT